ncbi:MAG: tyrosine--tRNA ligase, partial [Prevotella sp.]|nr:tyrosine--tRNA ligase [Prevotella sp.]
LWLYQHKGVKLQLGGNDQWGNMTTGTELIRRTLGSEVETFALTCPLITKADGKKFGKTEQGNIWLDPKRTTPYRFYQFWLNVSDEDAERYIKIFTSLDKETIDALVEEHKQDPGRRILQKRLAEEVTVMVHSQEALDMAIEASNILFGKSTKEALEKLDEQTFLDVFDGVPHFDITSDVLGQPAVEIFTQAAQVFPSKGEMRKMVQGGGVSLNKEKLSAFDRPVTSDDLIDGKYLLVQKGKKNYFLLTVK